MKRPSWNNYFLAMAQLVATRSTCLDKQVGCVLVDENGYVMATGYNGAPSKRPHCTWAGCMKQKAGHCVSIHAEMNALTQCANRSGQPYIAYCTLEPCKDCAAELKKAGVRRVFFLKETNPQKSGKPFFVQGTWEKVELPTYNLSIFEKIREYHVRLGYPKVHEVKPVNGARWLRDCSDDAVAQARDLLLALNQEAAELTCSFSWKPWKGYNGKRQVDVWNFLEEAGDIIFFLDSLLMNFGLSWEDLFSRMDEKLSENYKRIDNGYHD